MSFSTKYRSYSLRRRIFYGFLIISILSIFTSGFLSYFVVRNSVLEQSKTQMQKKTDALMASLDYAVSHTEIDTKELPKVLENKILEISDINKQDIILYDLNGNYLLSNKEEQLVPEKKVPHKVLEEVLSGNNRADLQLHDAKTKSTVTSSYLLLKNNMLEPIAIVYFPYYHNDSVYFNVIYKYVKYILLADLLIVAFSIWLSWWISKNLSTTLTQFSERINKLTLFEQELQPIRYYHNDELGTLVKAYNKMLLQIQDQKERLSHIERQNAWKEMAKQVAHEVKNPLTPMQLTIQNFERKFDPQDPQIHEKVKQMSKTIVDQIDLIASVATAFSQFAQLPDKSNEIFNLTTEIKSIIRIFSDDRIIIHANKSDIHINMDKIYLNRIITNLVTNAKQAESVDRSMMINIDIEQINKRISITVEDNGVGIPEEIIDRIFEPNFTSKSSGMGLGLAMVKKMIEDYDGEISVKSQLNMGTKFIIALPSNV